MMSSSIKTSGNYNEWPEEGYIPEDAYPLEVIHQDDTGCVLLQIDAMDADTLIVACQIDFDYESEGAVARKDIAGRELAPYRKLNLVAFYEGSEPIQPVVTYPCDSITSKPTAPKNTYCPRKATYAFVDAPFGTYYPERDTVHLCTRHFNLRYSDYVAVGEPYLINDLPRERVK
tara:strand:- start:182 stop:703 length:522 start_codon:yes stop_codon:yes gene_type:complete